MTYFPNIGGSFAGRFHIESELGRGGFGVVFAALDKTTMQSVALKVLKPGRQGYNPEMRSRFQREIEIVGRLQSDHTVRLVTHGVTDGLLWAAFELVPGRDLSALLKTVGVLSAGEAKHILVQILHSLREAHRLGLIHRDLKPENIRVFTGPHGPLTVKVLDFGIARSTDAGAPSITATGDLIGTPRYMSPEQLRGVPLTPASDIYSAGLLAYELVAGSDALGGNSFLDQIDRVLPTYEFSVEGADIETERFLVVLRAMLSADPRVRLNSAEAVFRALGVEMAPLHVAHTTQAQAMLPEQQGSETPSKMALIGAAVAIALLTVGAVATLISQPGEAPGPAAPPSERVNPLSNAVASAGDEAPSEGAVEPVAEDSPTFDPETGCALDAFKGEKTFGDAPGFLFVPENLQSEGAALVVLFSDGSNKILPEAFFDYTGVERVAAEKNYVVFAGSSQLAGKSSWSEGAVEIAWLGVEEVREQYCLKNAPILLLGEGKGAYAVDRTVQKHGVSIAAAATSLGRYKLGEPSGLEKLSSEAGLKRPEYERTTPGTVPYLSFSPRNDAYRPFEGGENDSGDGDWVSAVGRVERIEQAHVCKGQKEEVVNDPAGACWARDCQVPFQYCFVDERYWSPASWMREGVSGVSKFPYLTTTVDFFEQARSAFVPPLMKTFFHWAPKSFDPAKEPKVLVVFADRYMDGVVTDAYIDYLKIRRTAEKNNILILAFAPKTTSKDFFDRLNVARSHYGVPKSAPLFLLGERSGAMPALRLAKAHPGKFAGIATSSVLYEADDTVLASSGVPRVDFTPKGDGETPYNGQKATWVGEELQVGTAKMPAPLRHTQMRLIHECSEQPLSTTTRGQGVCKAFDCRQPLTICEIDAGQWWSDPRAFVPPVRARQGGPVAKFPHAEVMWEFFEEQLKPE